ncbi:Scr1 family TA system antitoxin-like transcriptional regulator [Spirillospora sp. NPDC029432]|uniref:Scr1 family TA system antitoxin-like transcriptional regulator n=1 Tax=Spirillospora sp. NPDC029432 TaxID=3154599 RepID=UPI0034542512
MAVEDRVPGSTVRRLVLGGELRRLREAAGVSRQEAGYAIRASESKISRLELGRVGFKERDVADLLTLYGVQAGTPRETLLRWARESNVPGWWHRHNDLLPHWFQTYLGLEEAASLIRTYEIQFVPGIVQTPEYARAVFRLGHPDAPDAEIERRVELRMRRQRRLWGPRALRLWTVIDEAALRRPLGGVEVMREQLEYLLALSRLPNVTVQVMPFRFGAHAAEGGAFSILRFPDPGVPDVAYLENLVGAVYLEKIDDLDRHLRVMERLSLTSESPDRSRDLLIDMLGPAGPERAGVRVRSRHLPVAERARGGGDARAVVDTPFGIRILMADALGKGPDAERATADVVAAFRDVAAHEPTLPGIAERLDGVLSHPERAGHPVTALLASVGEDGRLELVCCGHPAPLLLSDGRVRPVAPLPVVPPLGLLDLGDGSCEAAEVRLAPGDRLLICSNGLTGARDAGGGTFPLADRVAERLRDDPDMLLDGLLADLLLHVSGRPDDEAGALVVRFGTPPPAAGRSRRAGTKRA